MTAPIRSSEVRSKPSGAGLTAMAATRSNVTVSLLSPPRLRLDSIRQWLAATSAIDGFALPSCANTAMCLASLPKGMPRARPDKVPSVLIVMRSFGPAGATVISPSGRRAWLATATSPRAWFPPAAREAQNGLPRSGRQNPPPSVAPEPPYSSATQDTAGRLRSAPATAALSSRLSCRVDGLRIGQIGKYPLGGLRDNVLGFFHGVPRRNRRQISPKARVICSVASQAVSCCRP